MKGGNHPVHLEFNARSPAFDHATTDRLQQSLDRGPADGAGYRVREKLGQGPLMPRVHTVDYRIATLIASMK